MLIEFIRAFEPHFRADKMITERSTWFLVTFSIVSCQPPSHASQLGRNGRVWQSSACYKLVWLFELPAYAERQGFRWSKALDMEWTSINYQ